MDTTDLLAKVVIASPHVATRLSEYGARGQLSTGVHHGAGARALAAAAAVPLLHYQASRASVWAPSAAV